MFFLRVTVYVHVCQLLLGHGEVLSPRAFFKKRNFFKDKKAGGLGGLKGCVAVRWGVACPLSVISLKC